MTALEPLPTLLKRLHLNPRKGMGQNFLLDTEIARHIVVGAGVGPEDRVVEIGPGLGALTLPLLTATDQLTVIEQDKRLIPILKQRVHDTGKLTVLSGDALQTDYRALADHLGGPIHVVANLPYNISSPLLFRLLDQRESIISMTLMFQKEVADRIIAQPGGKSFGILSVFCQIWTDTELIMAVPPEAFYPAPKIFSAVVRMKVRSSPVVPISDPDLFRRIVKTAFSQRRKTLRNALKPLVPESATWLRQTDIDPSRRAETLSLEEFSRLAKNRHLVTP